MRSRHPAPILASEGGGGLVGGHIEPALISHDQRITTPPFVNVTNARPLGTVKRCANG